MHWIEKQKGFTLMEILIVIALISIISVFGIPGILSWMPDYRLRGAAGDLVSNFQKAKLTAVKQREVCAIEFKDGGYVVYIDEDGDQSHDAGEELFPPVNFAQDFAGQVSLDSAGFDANGGGNPWVAFRPNSLPLDINGGLGSGTVTLSNTKGKERDITLSPAGNIRMELK